MKTLALICFFLSSSPQIQSVHAYMSNGQRALYQKDWAAAVFCYEQAISTGMLNEMGAAVAYWNIYVAEANMNNVDKSMAALFGFLVHGSNTLDHPHFSTPAKEFQLKRKLSFGIVMLQAKWAHKNNYSCRSLLFACYTPMENMIEIFEREIPFCGNRNNITGAHIEHKDNILKYNISCAGTNETYYFITK